MTTTRDPVPVIGASPGDGVGGEPLAAVGVGPGPAGDVQDQQRDDGEHEQGAEHERATTSRPVRARARDPPKDHATMLRAVRRVRRVSCNVTVLGKKSRA